MLHSSQNQKQPRRRPFNGARPLFLLIAILVTLTPSFSLHIPNVIQTAHGSSQTTVTIVDNAFLPKHINVTTGTTVIWNYGSSGYSQHTVTSVGNMTQSGSPLLNSGTLNPGQSYQYTFYNPGVYTYQCSFHFTTPAMSNAWVNVTGSPITPPPSQTAPDYTTVEIIGGLVVAVAGTAAIVVVARKRKRPASVVK